MINAKILPRWLQKIVLKRRMNQNGGHLYQVWEIHGQPCITCLICGVTSGSRGDIDYKFCLSCGYYRDAERDLYVPPKNPYAA